MLKLKGITVDKLGFTPIKQGDLIYFEGPILSHFVGNDGKQYLFKWVDSNSEHNRWLIFNTNNVSLFSFFNKNVSLKKLILHSSPNLVHFIDIDDSLNITNITLSNIKAIPESYLPPDDSYYIKDEYELYARELAENLLNERELDQYVREAIREAFGVNSQLSKKANNIDFFDLFISINKVSPNVLLLPLILDLSYNFKNTREEIYKEQLETLLEELLPNNNLFLIYNKLKLSNLPLNYSPLLNFYSDSKLKQLKFHYYFFDFINAIRDKGYSRKNYNTALKSLKKNFEEIA